LAVAVAVFLTAGLSRHCGSRSEFDRHDNTPTPSVCPARNMTRILGFQAWHQELGIRSGEG
jgi:hypothetical protein